MPFEFHSRNNLVRREIRLSKAEPCTRNEDGDRSHGPRMRERDGDNIVEKCPNCGTLVDSRSDPLDAEEEPNK